MEKGQKLRKFCRRPKWVVPYTKTSVGMNGTLKIAHNLVGGGLNIHHNFSKILKKINKILQSWDLGPICEKSEL